ncbi:MAG: hypothetical protein GTO51_06365 [Candidatus Latescibacteria bacterium]|nr:hypothetical protein [Candidatus Latescibacterota bacterium]NIM21415.1 hypothetical protein [Candidatus Latescibacterota bacterium]NIM65596.1 hypothetical protein [Candidatus Latescibacterota bacterium]NIO01976.1 hypothetical protein [Candidatus Latescibacterota bacterium]NIO28788.1 hypothetical protein [Candidatus Latescibacterota bacterium]
MIPGTLRYSGETHLINIRQLSFGGENAEAYFNAEGTKLIFQSTRDTFLCDQIFEMTITGENVKLLSTGAGRTTCAYYFPNEPKILYSSTHLASSTCPPPPDFSKGYVWALYSSFDIFKADLDGKNIVPLTTTDGYDAEATIAPDGSKIVFTSMRDGDLDLYLMNPDGTHVERISTELGYDGGAFFSSNSKKIVYRAYHPKTEKEKQRYMKLLSDGAIEPMALQIFIMNADGSGKLQVTDNGAANFAPFFHPDGQRIIFASNLEDPRGHNFDLYMINIDSTNLERITYCPSFDSFPMFSPDGKKLVFASNRNNEKPRDTNIFIADWVP